jgi:hypothetical protein
MRLAGCSDGVTEKNSEIFRRKHSASRVSHSQTTSTRQPSASSSWRTRASRATLSRNLRSQNARLDRVSRRPDAHSCRCQKHPWRREPGHWELLDRLARTTLYGPDGTDVARRFILDRLREIIGSGEFVQAERCAEEYLGKKPAKKR